MLTNISWASYLTGLASLLAVYYSYVLVRYYRTDVIAFLQARPRDHTNKSSVRDNTAEQGPSDEDTYHQVEDFTEEISEHINQVYAEGLDKQKSLLLLKPTFERFAHLSHSPYRDALNELIVSECAKHGAVIVSEEDLAELWNEVA